MQDLSSESEFKMKMKPKPKVFWKKCDYSSYHVIPLQSTFDDVCDLSIVKIFFQTGDPWVLSMHLEHFLLILMGLCLG